MVVEVVELVEVVLAAYVDVCLISPNCQRKNLFNPYCDH